MACWSFPASSPTSPGDFFCHFPAGGKYCACDREASPTQISAIAHDHLRSISVQFPTAGCEKREQTDAASPPLIPHQRDSGTSACAAGVDSLVIWVDRSIQECGLSILLSSGRTRSSCSHY